eukprot:jgi/Orpsp1_1/1174324/evm.model.c7180000049684.2
MKPNNKTKKSTKSNVEKKINNEDNPNNYSYGMIYSYFMILWFLIISGLAYRYGSLLAINNFILYSSLFSVIPHVLTLVGIYKRNIPLLNKYKSFSKPIRTFNTFIIIISIINFFSIWKKDGLEKFRKFTIKDFENYSDEELKNYMLMSSYAMFIIGFIQIIIL